MSMILIEIQVDFFITGQAFSQFRLDNDTYICKQANYDIWEVIPFQNIVQQLYIY